MLFCSLLLSLCWSWKHHKANKVRSHSAYLPYVHHHYVHLCVPCLSTLYAYLGAPLCAGTCGAPLCTICIHHNMRHSSHLQSPCCPITWVCFGVLVFHNVTIAKTPRTKRLKVSKQYDRPKQEHTPCKHLLVKQIATRYNLYHSGLVALFFSCILLYLLVFSCIMRVPYRYQTDGARVRDTDLVSHWNVKGSSYLEYKYHILWFSGKELDLMCL